MRLGQAIGNVTGWPRAAGVSAILGEPFFSEDQVRFRHRELVWPLGDAVPEGLQIANLFRLRERAEPRRLRDAPALSRSGGHAATVRSETVWCQRIRKDARGAAALLAG